MDAKDLIQKAWVAEVAWLLLLYTVVLLAWPERVGKVIEALPLFAVLIGGQGVAGAAGPEVKRWLEGRNGHAIPRA